MCVLTACLAPVSKNGVCVCFQAFCTSISTRSVLLILETRKSSSSAQRMQQPVMLVLVELDICKTTLYLGSLLQVVVIRHPPSGAATMAHVDGFGEGESDLAQMTNILQNLAPRSGEDELELSLCGGFEDERGLSEELSLHLLSQVFCTCAAHNYHLAGYSHATLS